MAAPTGANPVKAYPGIRILGAPYGLRGEDGKHMMDRPSYLSECVFLRKVVPMLER